MKMFVFQWFRCFVGSPPFGACSWPVAGFFLASCWLPRQSVPPENRFFKGFPKLVNSLHENACFQMVSMFRGVPPIWGLFLASCWRLGFLLASSFPTRISLENRFFKRFPKLVNALHEKACFSMNSVIRGVPLDLGPLPGFLLASCRPLAGLLLASCWLLAGLLLASSWPLAGPFLASCWPLPGFPARASR